MAVLWLVLQAITAAAFVGSVTLLLLAAIFESGCDIRGKELRYLLDEKMGDIEKGQIYDWSKSPPAWLRVPRWLIDALDRENEYAGSHFPLNGRQLAAWCMMRFGQYTLIVVACLLVGVPLLLLAAGMATTLKVGLVVVGVVLGMGTYQIWDFYARLRRRGKERLEAIRRQLPYAVDLFVLVLDAGGDFGTALEAFNAFGPEGATRREVQLMLQETRAGLTRDDVWRRFAQRNPISEVERLALVVRQGERMGTPLVDTLRGQAELLRAERLQRATAIAERMAIDARLWLTGIAVAVMLLLVGPFLLSMVPGLRSVFR